ncbi:MAG: hypothetical protein ACRD19_05185 [Terriglobia bacterium]
MPEKPNLNPASEITVNPRSERISRYRLERRPENLAQVSQPSVGSLTIDPDPRAAAERLRALAAKLPPAKLDYAAELVRTAWELEIAAEEREKHERIAAAGGAR